MKTRRTLCVIGIVIGALLLTSPLVSLWVTDFGMRHAFEELGNDGIAEPNRLAGHIGTVLWISAGGLIGLIAGVVILTASFVWYIRACRIDERRKKS